MQGDKFIEILYVIILFHRRFLRQTKLIGFAYQMVVQREQCPLPVNLSSCDVLDPLSPVRSAADHSPQQLACTLQMKAGHFF